VCGLFSILTLGQLVWLPYCLHILFVGSPRITSLEQLQQMNAYLSDIPLYDVTRELVLLKDQRVAESDIAYVE
jgi:guanylate cyclase soluble subunit beta